MPQLIRIFIDVLVPVFGVAGAGFVAAKLVSLDHKPMGTLAYWLLVPAFIFRTLSDPAALDGPVVGMLASTVVTIAIVWAGFSLLLRNQPGERRVIDTMSASLGNVGNLGFPIVLFALGEAALPSAVIHFLATTVCIFGFGVAASSRLRSGHALVALKRVATTPAIVVMPFGFLMAATEWTLPTAPGRLVGLLADAMIPVMLLTLGMQLASSHIVVGLGRLSQLAMGKLVLMPLVFLGVATVVGLDGFALEAGLLLSAMPTAVLVALIGIEFDLQAEVASASILFTSIVSLATLSVLLALL